MSKFGDSSLVVMRLRKDSAVLHLLPPPQISDPPTELPPGSNQLSYTLSPSSLVTLQRDFEEMRCAWQQTPFHKHIIRTTKLAIGTTTSFENAVCVGVGSLEHHTYTYTNGTGVHCDSKRSWRQVMLFLDIIELITQRTMQPITLCAHDPKLTDLDAVFLTRLGIEVVSEPVARSRITSRTFLFTPFLNWCPLLQRYLAGKDPSLYVGNALQRLTLPKLECLAYAAAFAVHDPVGPDVHARAMLAVRDEFMRSRRMVSLDEGGDLGGNDVPGIMGLYAFVKR